MVHTYRPKGNKESEFLDPAVTLFKNDSDQDGMRCYVLEHIFKTLMEHLGIS